MAVLMQRDVRAVPESTPGGSEDLGRMRKLGTTSLNHGVVERSSLNHCPVGPWESLLRLKISASARGQYCSRVRTEEESEVGKAIDEASSDIRIV